MTDGVLELWDTMVDFSPTWITTTLVSQQNMLFGCLKMLLRIALYIDR